MADLVIDTDIYKKTLSGGQRFLLKDRYENGHRMIIFSSDIQLRMLGNSKRFGVDRTIRTCAGLFECESSAFFIRLNKNAQIIILSYYKTTVLF